MSLWKISFVVDGYDITTDAAKARTLAEAKTKLRIKWRRRGRKITSLTFEEVES